jgi:hypothetical protein
MSRKKIIQISSIAVTGDRKTGFPKKYLQKKQVDDTMMIQKKYLRLLGLA